MNRTIPVLLPAVLIVIVLLFAGCTGQPPAENTTVVPQASPVPSTAAPVTLPAGTTALTVQPQTTTPAPVVTPKPVATETTKERTQPTVSSIVINSAGSQVGPTAYDRGGGVTRGNVIISGTIDSSTGYPVWVDMRVDLYGANLDVPKATAYDTVRMYPYGTSEFTFQIDNYTFNPRPDPRTTLDTYTITIVKVTVIPS